MGSRTAKLVARAEGSVEFDCDGRRYRLPDGAELVARAQGRRARRVDHVWGGVGEDARVVFADGGRRSRLSSVVVDYDLSQHQLEGEAPLPMPRPERPEREPRPENDAATQEGPGVALAPLVFDGDTLEVIELDGEGWVSFPSLLRPFGKRAVAYAGLLDGWARTRIEKVASRTTALDGRGGGAQDTTLLHFEDAPMAIARLDRRGMEEDVKAKHTRYLKECAKVLADYFLRGRAENPRAAGGDADLPPWVRGLFEAVGGAAVAAQQTANAAAGAAGAAARTADEAKAEAGAARATAEEAKAVAEEARAAAHAATSDPTAGVPAGRSRRVPDGTVAREAPPGFVSRREVARRFALPTTGAGAALVSSVAEMVRVEEIEGATCLADVVIGGVARNVQLRYGPLAIDAMAVGLRAAHATIRALGYHADLGALAPIQGWRGKLRGPTYVLRHAIEAATRALAPSGPNGGGAGQQTIPGVENDTQPKAS
jgi:hypothetical protein